MHEIDYSNGTIRSPAPIHPGAFKAATEYMLSDSPEMPDDDEEELIPSDKYMRMVKYYKEKVAKFTAYWALNEERTNPQKYLNFEDDNNSQGYLDPGTHIQTRARHEAQMLGSPPQFLLSGFTRHIEKTRVPAFERMINNEWTHDRETMQEATLVFRDTWNKGVGYFITTYDEEFPADPEKLRRVAKRRRQQVTREPILSAIADDLMNQAAQEAIETEPPELKLNYELDSRVKTSSINTRRVQCPIIDPDCTSLADAQYVGREIMVRTEAARRDPRFIKAVAEQLQPTHEANDFGALVQSPYEKTRLYELFCLEWCEEESRWRWYRVTLAEGLPHLLEKTKSPLFIGHPYTEMVWNTNGNDPFGMSQATVFEDLYRTFVELTTKMVDGYSRENERTTFFNKANMSEQEIQKLTVGEPPRYFGLEPPPGTDLREMFHELTKQPNSPEGVNFYAVISSQLERALGVGANQQQQALKSDTSAREVAAIEMAVQLAISNIQRGVEMAMVKVARARLGLAAQFYDKERIARIAGSEAAQAWPSTGFSEADVIYGLSLHIHKGSMLPRNDTVDFQNGVTFAQLMGANPYFAANCNWFELQRFLSRKLSGTTGETFLVEHDPEKAMELFAQMQAAQMLQGNVPSGGQAQGTQPGAPA